MKGAPTDCTTAVYILTAMAGDPPQACLLCRLAMLCLLLASNLRPVAAEARKNREDADVEEVHDFGEQDHSNKQSGDDIKDLESVAGGNEEEDDEEGEEEEDDGQQEPVDETDVVVLGASNFTAFVVQQRSVLVAFYAPRCGHCTRLAREWAAVATALKGQVSVATVDANVHSNVSEAFHVTSYPTLLFFLDGMHSSYHGNWSKYVAFPNFVLELPFQSCLCFWSIVIYNIVVLSCEVGNLPLQHGHFQK